MSSLRLEDLPLRWREQVAATGRIDLAHQAASSLHKALGPVITAQEAEQAPNRPRREVKEMHEPFRQWCTLHALPFVYHRPDRPSGIRTGWPDFTVLRAGRVVCVEFKWPGQQPTDIQTLVRAAIEAGGTPYLVAHDAGAAIAFVREKLGISV